MRETLSHTTTKIISIEAQDLHFANLYGETHNDFILLNIFMICENIKTLKMFEKQIEAICSGLLYDICKKLHINGSSDENDWDIFCDRMFALSTLIVVYKGLRAFLDCAQLSLDVNNIGGNNELQQYHPDAQASNTQAWDYSNL